MSSKSSDADLSSGSRCPADWQETPLSSVVEIRFSGVNKVSQPGENPVRLCNYIDVYKNDYIVADMPFMQATATAAEIERFGLRNGDVIITKDSETPDDIAVPAVVDSTAPDLVCGYHLALIRPDLDAVDPTFLAKQLGHYRLARYFGQQANGSTRYGLSTAAIANAPLHLPKDLGKQKTAGNLMRLLDRSIAKTEVVIAKLKQMRTGLVHDLLTRGLDHNGRLRDQLSHPEYFQDSPLGQIPIGWSFGALGTSIDLIVGPAFESSGFSTGDQGVRLLRGLNVTQGHVRWGEEITERWPQVSPSLTRYLLETGDVVIGMDGALVGRNVAALTSGDVPSVLVQRVARIRGLPQLKSAYAYLLLTIPPFLRHIDTRKTHTAIPHITANDIRDYLVVIPKPEEQQWVLETVAKTDCEIKAVEHEHKKLVALMAGVTSDLLSGRVPMPNSLTLEVI